MRKIAIDLETQKRNASRSLPVRVLYNRPQIVIVLVIVLFKDRADSTKNRVIGQMMRKKIVLVGQFPTRELRLHKIARLV
jgi:hypothetical protein